MQNNLGSGCVLMTTTANPAGCLSDAEQQNVSAVVLLDSYTNQAPCLRHRHAAPQFPPSRHAFTFKHLRLKPRWAVEFS